MPLPNVCRVGWYQRWTSFVPFSASVPARNPSQVAWYPLSNSPPDFRIPSTFQNFFLFFSKIHLRTICNERSRQRRYMINSAKKVEFFFSGVRNIHLRRANCATLARLFRFLPGLLVPCISFLSTVSRFLYKHAHPGLERIGRQLGAHFFFKPFFDKFITILVFLLFLVFPM